MERWKEEERMKLRAEMDGLKQLFLGELKDIASRSSAMEGVSQRDSKGTSELAALHDPGGLAGSQPEESPFFLEHACTLDLGATTG